MTKTPDTERQARSRALRAQEGGKQVAVFLTPLAAEKLARWLQRGLNATQAINKLLERSKP